MLHAFFPPSMCNQTCTTPPPHGRTRHTCSKAHKHTRGPPPPPKKTRRRGTQLLFFPILPRSPHPNLIACQPVFGPPPDTEGGCVCAAQQIKTCAVVSVPPPPPPCAINFPVPNEQHRKGGFKDHGPTPQPTRTTGRRPTSQRMNGPINQSINQTLLLSPQPSTSPKTRIKSKPSLSPAFLYLSPCGSPPPPRARPCA